MYYLLKENMLLRGWERLPFALTNSSTGRTSFFRDDVMELLLRCDGHTNLENLPDEAKAAIQKMEEAGWISRCSFGNTLRPEQTYRRYKNRYIRSAHWSVTGRCNYRCKHCYMSAPEAKYGELDHDTAMNIARQIVDCGIYEVSLTGGECLVRKDFFDLVDVLVDGGVRVSTIYSNGRLVTDKLLRQLEDRGIRPEFNMSYDGLGWHDWLRGVKGAEDDVNAAFLRCREHGFPTGAEMCIHEGNKHTLRDTVLHLRDVGCRGLKTNPISDVGAWHDGGYGAGIRIDALYRLYTDYIPKYYEDGMPLSLQLGGFFDASPNDPGHYMIPVVKRCSAPDSMCICGHARMVMYISAEGRVLPCMSLSGMEIQENYPLIQEIGLARAISDSSYMRLIDTRASEFFAHNPDCASCKYAMSCVGGCRASALETTPDDILAPDMACCSIFQGSWIPKIVEAVKSAAPDARCRTPLDGLF